jgi:hypothetical protein
VSKPKPLKELLEEVEGYKERCGPLNPRTIQGWAQEMGERLRAIDALHQQHPDPFPRPPIPYCVGCDLPWPCPTRKALDGVK